jgi:hypothetical protein
MYCAARWCTTRFCRARRRWPANRRRVRRCSAHCRIRPYPDATPRSTTIFSLQSMPVRWAASRPDQRRGLRRHGRVPVAPAELDRQRAVAPRRWSRPAPGRACRMDHRRRRLSDIERRQWHRPEHRRQRWSAVGRDLAFRRAEQRLRRRRFSGGAGRQRRRHDRPRHRNRDLRWPLRPHQSRQRPVRGGARQSGMAAGPAAASAAGLAPSPDAAPAAWSAPASTSATWCGSRRGRSRPQIGSRASDRHLGGHSETGSNVALAVDRI